MKKDGGILYLEYLSECSKLTDDEIVKRSSSSFGLDAVSALSMTLERELCKSIIKNLKERSKKCVGK